MNLAEILDTKVVRDFRRIFHQFTGMATSFYFAGWKQVSVEVMPRSGKSSFCSTIHASPDGLEMCRRYDFDVLESVRSEQITFMGPCHAGVTCIAVPIFFHGECQGAMCAGYVHVRKPTRADFNRVRHHLKDLDIDFRELEKAYFDIPVISRQKLKAALELLSVIANYIVEREESSSLHEAIYRKQQEVSDSMSARLELEKGLQDKMMEVRSLRQQLLAATSPEKVAVLTESAGVRKKRIVREALSFIDHCYMQNICLKDVADHVNLSPFYFSTLFRKECNCTFVEYLTHKRISKACECLQDLRFNVSEAAAQVGYESISHFSRLFKKLMGVTPGQYRDSIAVGEDAPGH